MSTMRHTARRVVLLKTESAQSTPVVPAATDAIYVRDLEITPAITQEERDYYRQTIGRLPSIPGESLFNVAFKTELVGSGTPGVAYAPLDAMYQACAFLPAVHAGAESVGAAVPKPGNLGVSPAPVIEVVAPGFSAKSGIIELTLINTTETNPEDAIFQAVFYPGDGSPALTGQATVTDLDFTDNAFDNELTGLQLTTNDPDGIGVGDPVSTWQVGDRWTFVYTSADQVDVQYKPTSVAASANYFGFGKSMTMNAYYDGTKRIVAGIMGSIKSIHEVNKIGMFEFKGMGIYAGPADVAFPAQTYNATMPEILISSGLTVQGFQMVATKAEFDIGNTVSKRLDTRAATGILGFHIPKREPVGSLDPEYELVATHDYIGRLRAGTLGALTMQHGQVAGNKCTITAPKLQYMDFKDTDREGGHACDIGFAMREDAGDDELVYTFT